MSTALAAAPVDQKRKKANKISQQPPPPQPSAGQGGPDGPPVTSVEHSLSSSMGTGAWSGHVAQDPHDEVQIVKKGPSTFDELLERELARDQASQAAQPSKSSSRATFLKRGSGAGAALAKVKIDDEKQSTPTGESSDDRSRTRQPLAETSRNNQDSTTIRQKGSASRPSTAPQTQLAANVWDDVAVCGGGGAHPRQPPRREPVRAVARKLDVDDRDVVLALHKPQSAAQRTAFCTKDEVESSTSSTHLRRSLGKDTNRDNDNRRSRQLQQLNPDEEAELLEFELLERKVVQAGADDSIYRSVLKQDPYSHFDDDDDRSEKAGEESRHSDDSEDGEVQDSAGLTNTYIFDESEVWDIGRDAAADLSQHDGEDAEEQEAGNQQATRACRGGDGSANEARGEQTRSNLVNKLFIQKQPKGRQIPPQQPQRKSLAIAAGNTTNTVGAPGKASLAATAATAHMGSKGAEREEVLSSTSLRQSSDISSQLAELDKEIREFRQQNQMLERLRQEVEAERQQLELEKASLSEHLRDAEQRFERYKEAELKKMKKDRKDIDKQLQLAQAQVADLRGERDSMRKEMQVLQEDAARRERKLKAEVERVKKKMEEANTRNEELVRELKFSEEARVALQDREQLASLKARVRDRSDRDSRTHSLSLPPPSPRSQDSLATLIATSAVTAVEAEDNRRDAQLSSLLAGVQRAGGTDERKNESEYISAPSGYVSGSSIQSSACVSLHPGSSRFLDTSTSESRWQARERESGRREHDDSVHSAMNSFQGDRTCLITDETLEIDVAKLRKHPSSAISSSAAAAREQHHQHQHQEEEEVAESDAASVVVSEKQHGDGKIERVFADGKRLLVFSNGTRKEVFPGGGSVVHFSNKDVKHTFPDGKIVYFYAETRTSHTTHADGMEMFDFSNGQREKHFPDGRKEILFPDGTLKNIHTNKQEDSIFPDGTIQRIFTDGTRVIEFPNGSKETVSPNGNKVLTRASGLLER